MQDQGAPATHHHNKTGLKSPSSRFHKYAAALHRIVAFAFAVAALLAAVAATAAPAQESGAVHPNAGLASAPYASWAHDHWVWLDNDVSNQANVTQLVADYKAHNITVGAVDIDSGWSTGFNNFVVDTNKFPDLKQLVADLHAQDIKVLLWATSMIDTDSTNYATALNNSYFVTNAFKKFSTLKWWHGKGGLLDYTNPKALQWWHSQLDNVLDLGIDGWKTDGTDPYVIEYVVPHGYSGELTYRDYADAYYGDFFNYTRTKNGNHCLIMSRPVDSYPLLGQAGAYLNFSPRDVVFSGWVGDEDPTWDGLSQAMTNMIYSAWYNYTNFGSDIGGYRSGPGELGRTVNLFTRWFQLGAFLPLMENGGGKEHRPWKFDAPGSTVVTDTYRTFVSAHMELGPYLLTTGTEAYESGVSSVRPMQAPPKSLFILQLPDIKTPAYMLGANYFVHPILENGTTVRVSFPTGNDTWVNYFRPTEKHLGGTNATIAVPMNLFPAFVKHGAVTPLRVSTDAMHHGNAASADALTFAVYGLDVSGRVVTQDVREFEGTGMRVSYSTAPSNTVSGAYHVTWSVSAHATESVILLLRGVRPAVGAASTRVVAQLASPAAASLAELRRAPHPATGRQGWSWQSSAASPAATDDVFVRVGRVPAGATITVTNVVLTL